VHGNVLGVILIKAEIVSLCIQIKLAETGSLWSYAVISGCIPDILRSEIVFWYRISALLVTNINVIVIYVMIIWK
jgi:hypothetical protein